MLGLSVLRRDTVVGLGLTREHRHEGDVAQSSRSRHQNTHKHGNHTENHRALRMVRKCVQHLRPGKNVKANQQNIVGEQHESGELVGNFGMAKSVIAKVADVLDLGILHDVLVHGDGSDPEKNAGSNHGDDTGDPAENGEGPSLGHDGETNLVAAEEPGGLLP